jgi:tetratricopeptide (TPR) repeat protein
MRERVTRIAFAALAGLATGTAFAQADPATGTSAPAAREPAASSPTAAAALPADIFYRLLVGDIALQRGEPAVAARAYLEAARAMSDPALARRATEIALMTRQRPAIEQAARLWQELDPAAERPGQIIAAVASGNMSRLQDESPESELRARLERFLADAAVSGTGVGEPFLQINRVFSHQSDKAAVFRLVVELAKPYPGSAEAQFAIALAGLNTGLADPAIATAAMAAADRALALKPDWDRAVLLKAELLGKSSASRAIAYIEAALAKSPQSRALKIALAQHLVEQKRFAEARTLYRSVLAVDPSQRELQFGAAVLSVQMKDWDAAETDLQALKGAGYGEAGQVEFYLAQVAEERGHLEQAIARYRDVPDGERAWLARLRIAVIMGKQGKRDEARRFLAELPAVTIEQRVQVRQTEAQLYRDANDHVGALAILDQGLAELPESTDLVYDRAMVLEKLDRIDDAEKALRRLVEMKPDDAHALNALGYTLVDRTPRVDEGFQLLEKAHRLAPADPFILDSMGWALYRMGRLDEAEQYLARAFAERPDPEIAAHWGEVLWAKGQQQKAKDIWQSQLKTTPDHPLLLETMRRHSR